MRVIALLLLAIIATASTGASNPLAVPTKLDPAWQAKARAMFQAAIEIPSVMGRGQVPQVADLVASELKKGGFAAGDIRILPYEGQPGDKTVALLLRWRASNPVSKPMLILGHMDVVEAKREDWKFDPFKLREEGGYFYGRGTSDMKNGVVATTMALVRLKQAGFKPRRDIILFLNGDEETMQNGVLFGTKQWRPLIDSEFALNADATNSAYGHDLRPLGFAMGAAEKTYQTYLVTARNKGGHSGRPVSDNAIYDLSEALLKIKAHRFTPSLNPTTRAYFAERQKHEQNALGDAMRRWLANENDQEAADIIEANEVEIGRTRTTCVATMLEAGHADNALPQRAKASVNCRIMPGHEPATVQAELQRAVGPKIEVVPDPAYIATPTPVLPIRSDVMAAFTKAVRRQHGAAMPIIPWMDTGTSDASVLRAAGIPTFVVSGSWGISPDDERQHGLDERLPVRALYDDVLFWETMVRELAGGG
jgi:acetylornithine deacetylase/succinyl-diaminopimelate desuccinylase-like protein